MAADDDDLLLVDPWEDLRKPDEAGEREVQRLTQELRREVSPGHVLYQVSATLIGKSWARDDVLLRLADRWAIVHLTGSGKPERPPWPSTRFYDSVAEVEAEMDADL